MSTTQTTRSTSGHGQLLRILGVSFGVAVSIGTIIGAGILRTPGEVAGHLQAPWLITTVWFLGGIYALMERSALWNLGPCCHSKEGGMPMRAEHSGHMADLSSA